MYLLNSSRIVKARTGHAVADNGSCLLMSPFRLNLKYSVRLVLLCYISIYFVRVLEQDCVHFFSFLVKKDGQSLDYMKIEKRYNDSNCGCVPKGIPIHLNKSVFLYP